jgi:hypothetical protein
LLHSRAQQSGDTLACLLRNQLKHSPNFAAIEPSVTVFLALHFKQTLMAKI